MGCYEYSGLLWAAMGDMGAMGYLGPAMGHFWPLWATMGAMGHIGLLWTAMDVLGTMGHFGPAMGLHGCYRP